MATQDSIVLQTRALLACYGFEIKGQTGDQIIEYWLTKYTPAWLRLAIIEALYLGRYKAISVEQILSIWLRKGSPSYHFNHDFERLICRKLPLYLQNISQEYSENNDKNSYLNESDRKNTKKSLQFSNPIVTDRPSERQKSLETVKTAAKNSEILTISRENLTKADPSANYKVLAEKKVSTIESKKAPQTADRTDNKTTVAYKPNWIYSSNDRRSIDRFMPLPDRSQFYLKLKAVAQKHSV